MIEHLTMKQKLFADKIEAAVFLSCAAASLLLATLVIASQVVGLFS